LRTLIVGAGRIGMHLVRYLSASDENKLTVIEKKKELCKEVASNFDAVIINEDGSNLEIMKKAEASQADLMILATDDDRANIAATKLAKKEFGIPIVYSVANSPKNKEKLKRAGADIVICPVELALRDFENILSGQTSTTLMYRPDLDLKVAETTLPVNASMIGKKVHELKLPEKCRLALISRGTEYIFPEPEVELMPGDKVLVLGDAPSVEKTLETLKSSETA